MWFWGVNLLVRFMLGRCLHVIGGYGGSWLFGGVMFIIKGVCV